MSDQKPPRRVLRLPDVEAKTGLTRDVIYRLGREGTFPRPIRIGKVATGWLEHEVDAYIDGCAAERDAGLIPTLPRKNGRLVARSVATCDAAPPAAPSAEPKPRKPRP